VTRAQPVNPIQAPDRLLLYPPTSRHDRKHFYGDDQQSLESRVLHQGDVLLLAFGGHGFEMLEPSETIEVKQGPYAGAADKTRFRDHGGSGSDQDQMEQRFSSRWSKHG
jgi:hypothetical protein